MPKILVQNLDKSVESFEINEDEILYHGLERQGKILPHGCLAGACGICRIEILQGSEVLLPKKAVEEDTVSHILKKEYEKEIFEGSLNPQNVRLACRTKVKGNLTIRHLDTKQ